MAEDHLGVERLEEVSDERREGPSHGDPGPVSPLLDIQDSGMNPCYICGDHVWQQVIDYQTTIHVNEATLVETRVSNPDGPVTTSTCVNGHITKS